MRPLIIFDCDGVLVDSELIASTVFAKHLLSAGFCYSQAECQEQFTGLSLDSCRILIEQQGRRFLPEGFFYRLQQETLARLSESLQPVHGVVEVLEFLDNRQWAGCVASSGSHDKMAVTLGKVGLDKYFTGRIFSADDVKHGKPAPDLFLHAARSQGYRPDQCIVIEDAGPGILAGIAAGMQVCAFGARHSRFEQARVFSSMSELPAILLELESNMFYERKH